MFSNRKSECFLMLSAIVFFGYWNASLVIAQLPTVKVNEPSKVSGDHVARVQKGLSLFKEHVRQILQDHCLDCHGGKSVKADFNLSSREQLMKSGFVSDRAQESYLFELVTHQSEPHMPLKADRLSDQEIDWIEQWIDSGAPYDQPLVEGGAGINTDKKVVSDQDRAFWSFQPLKKVAIPKVVNQQWCRTPIDYFIQQRLEEKGLAGNSLASGRTLARRASLDLLGLPPSLESVQSLSAEFSNQNWETYVEQLLDSQHYGERWARHWMDVARFAESHGYEQDYDRPHAYHYRDFLIKAFNQDMPYDQFARWQLAGDELAPDRPLAMMATGFLGAGVFPTQLTEAEFESARYDELDDMVATTGVTFLGLSVGCARCHDHKFDPITSADYYSMAANFTSTIRSEIELDLNPEENASKIQQWNRKIDQVKQRMDTFETDVLPKQYATWLSEVDFSKLESKWVILEDVTVTSDAGTKYEKQKDQSWLAVGSPAPKEVITVEGISDLRQVNQIRLEALTHPSLPRNGPGRADNGNFALGDVEVSVVMDKGQQTSEKSSATDVDVSIALDGAIATHQQNGSSLSVAASIDGDKISGWAVDSGGIGKEQAAVFTLKDVFENQSQNRWRVVLTFQHPNQKHVMGRFRISFSSFSDAPLAVGTEGIPGRIKQALKDSRVAGPDDQEAWSVGLRWYKESSPEWAGLVAELETLQTEGPPVALTKVMVSSEGVPHMKHHADGRGYPHFYPQTFVLERGDVEQKQGEADAGFLTVLTPIGKNVGDWQVANIPEQTALSYRRSALANWLTDVDHGAGALVARVIVNRLWQHHFGQGLVATPNDFGLSGSAPTHPELLDWLAAELIRQDWKLKPIHRLIMTSAVYMQSTSTNVLKQQEDSQNLWLSRWIARRAEGEVIRDSMLAVSGQLDPSMYGPGTLNENMKRRSIYFFIKRSKLIPSMMLFDWPEHLVSIGKRSQTTIAPQALSFLNSSQGRECARGLADRLTKKTIKGVVDEVFWLALSRAPRTEEQRLGETFMMQQEKVYAGQTPAGAFRNACVDLCQMVMSTNEFIYIE